MARPLPVVGGDVEGTVVDVARPEVQVESSKVGMKLLQMGCWRSDQQWMRSDRQVLSKSTMRWSNCLELRSDRLEARSDHLVQWSNCQVLSKVAVWHSNYLRPRRTTRSVEGRW
jgi:hypothetical protein